VLRGRRREGAVWRFQATLPALLLKGSDAHAQLLKCGYTCACCLYVGSTHPALTAGLECGLRLIRHPYLAASVQFEGFGCKLLSTCII
jgi:hypothetical protein